MSSSAFPPPPPKLSMPGMSPPPPISSLPPPPPPLDPYPGPESPETPNRTPLGTSSPNAGRALPPPIRAPSEDKTHTAGESFTKINHKALINNPSFADVQFMIGKKIVHAHSFILALRGPRLIDIKGTPIKKKKGIIQREMGKDVRENILLEVLGYLYTDEIDFSKMPVPDILQVNAYAMEFEIHRLVWLCETHLREMLNTDNMYDVLIEANKVSQVRIKDFCFHFIVRNYDVFISNKPKTSSLGIELFQDAIAVNQQKDNGTLKPLELKPSPPSTLREDFKKLYDTMKEQSEATMFKVGINAQVQYPLAHRAILAGQTPVLHNLCSSPFVKEKNIGEFIPIPNLRTRAVFENISQDAFETLLKYVYFGSADIPTLLACELIPFTIDYAMAELQTICYKKIQSNINEQTALMILQVCYIQPPSDYKEALFLPSHPEVTSFSVDATRKASMDFILDHLATSDLALLPRMFWKISVDLVLANQRKERVAKGLPIESPSTATVRPGSVGKIDGAKIERKLSAIVPAKEPVKEPAKELIKVDKSDKKGEKKEKKEKK